MMKDNKFDQINEALDTSIESSITEIKKDAVPIPKQETDDVTKDYEYTSGMNKVCRYDCLGQDHAITIGATYLCPLTVKR